MATSERGCSPDPFIAKARLRVIACGSVDDGKSTLIGRLLLEAGAVHADHLERVRLLSRKFGTTPDGMDLALLLDGLEAEREQGITIDVAYRYFSFGGRPFILADAPGHEQYVRNMATAASTADVAILLVDVRKGLLPQTLRHCRICALFGIRHVVLAINKMDLIDYAAEPFEAVSSAFAAMAANLDFHSVVPVPVSARDGEGVFGRSVHMPWYCGPTLIEALDTAPTVRALAEAPFRYPVQLVSRPTSDVRVYAGTVASGSIVSGQRVVIASSGRETNVTRIVTFDGDLDRAEAGDAVALVLADDIDVSRGEVFAAPQRRPAVADQFAADLVWLDEAPFKTGNRYWLRCGTKTVSASISVHHTVDIDTFAERPAHALEQNDIAKCSVETDGPIAFDAYRDNRCTGAFILIDQTNNATVAAGMIRHAQRHATNVHLQFHTIDAQIRARLLNQTPRLLWFTGLSSAGKSTIADHVERILAARGRHTMLIDGDNLRHGLNSDLGFTNADRDENIRRAAEVGRLMVDAGLIVIAAFISPLATERRKARERFPLGAFVEIFVDTPLDECIRRDPKGLYARALAGQLPNFTGVGAPYEPPAAPELRIDGQASTAAAAAAQVVAWLDAHE